MTKRDRVLILIGGVCLVLMLAIQVVVLFS